jgi:hypothetical protein
MTGRVTLREVRKALAAARASGAKESATPPTIQELEALARLLERQAAADATASPTAAAPTEEPSVKGTVKRGGRANGGGRRGSRRSGRSRVPRRR